MRLIGCDLHATQQSIAMLDCETGAVIEKTLKHEGECGPGVLCLDSGAGGRRDRSDRVDGVVPAVDGGAGHRVPRGASVGDSEGGDASAEARSP